MKRLFIFVEGAADERFFRTVVVPLLQEKGYGCTIVRYAEAERTHINRLLKSITEAGGDYIFVADINASPCVTAKKDLLCKRYPMLSRDRTVIVIREIESWYVAGPDPRSRRRFGIQKEEATDHLTKDQVEKSVPLRYRGSKAYLHYEMLKRFDVSLVKKNNASFQYFLRKYLKGERK
ncbi:MAG: hypothetical protein RMK62_00670 [Armatimonadota bacterium]|nr:hypothetical protein [Armatimonadota bacterium]